MGDVSEAALDTLLSTVTALKTVRVSEHSHPQAYAPPEAC